MGFDYASLRDGTVEPLLGEFGTTGKMLVPGAPAGPDYDPQPAADVEHDATFVRTRFTKEDIAGGNVQADDVAFLMSTEGVTIDPELAYRVEVGSVVYQVIGIEPLKPGPIVMLWRVHARK